MSVLGHERRFERRAVTPIFPRRQNRSMPPPYFRGAINGRKRDIERCWRGSSFIVQNDVRRDLRAMVPEHPSRIGRRLSAIVPADVAGYSRLMGLDETGTARILREHRVIADAVVAKHGGRIVKTTGDGVLLEFTSVVDAVECAVAVQAVMAERNERVPHDRRMLFRIGINLGDILVEGDDILGDGVNVAARLEGIAEPGGICISSSAYDQVHGKVGVEFADLGEQRLKNIARPVRAYAVVRQGLRVGTNDVTTPISPSAPHLSIVVLPFVNIGGDPEQEYFADGVTDSLTTDLSRISGAFVIARNTAFTFKGKAVDVKQLGRELNVRYVLEGSMQRSGNRLRVNVQLVDAETGNYLWAERFQKPVTDLFDVQDEIVSRLANTLNAQLIEAEARRAQTSLHPDAVDFFFQGIACFHKGIIPEHLAQARGFFERALALDPKNIEALVGTAIVDANIGAVYVTDDRAVPFAAAEVALIKALSSVPGHALAHAYLGVVYMFTNRAAQGIAECERALALNPNLAAAHGWIGFAKLLSGRAEETEVHVNEALRLSPRDDWAYVWMGPYVGGAKLHLGAYEEAVGWLQRSIETNRNMSMTHLFLASAFAHLGRLADARSAVQAGLALAPGFTITRFRAGAESSHNPVFLKQRERIYEGMRLAGVPEGDDRFG
jgi:TolB-like protein/class 3 adenylate cyclase